MRDLESRMPELLRRAAGGPPRDPELERRVCRARRRRVVNASVSPGSRRSRSSARSRSV